jgi:hypothetical protein
MSSILSSLSVAQLKHAVTVKERIEQLEAELSGIARESPKAISTVAPIVAPKMRTMSAAAKAKISAAQKARWAKERGEEPPKVATTPVAKPKRILSAAARAKISAGTKARWAKTKAVRD